MKEFNTFEYSGWESIWFTQSGKVGSAIGQSLILNTTIRHGDCWSSDVRAGNKVYKGSIKIILPQDRVENLRVRRYARVI